MLRRRFHRLSTTLIVVLSLLFSQLALASYVCPQQADVEAMAAMMEAGVPCEGMDTEQPALCHEHSANPAKTFEALKLPVLAQPAIVQVLELPLLLQAPSARAVPPMAAPEAHAPPDPLFLATLRLRF
jgi:hypothetical protein